MLRILSVKGESSRGCELRVRVQESASLVCDRLIAILKPDIRSLPFLLPMILCEPKKRQSEENLGQQKSVQKPRKSTLALERIMGSEASSSASENQNLDWPKI